MENKQPVISIITVCYNSEKTIERTIKSVLNQSFKDYEYLIIDGKSSDSTLEIVKKYEPLFEGRLKWISEKDTGIYNAMNKGIKLSKGKLIGIINSDDWYEDNIFETIERHYLKSSESILYGLMKNYDSKKILRNISATTLINLSTKMIEHPTCFVPKKIYDKYGSFDEQYKFAADYELILRFYINKINFILIEKPIANFVSDGATAKNKELSSIETYKIKYKYKLVSTWKFSRKIIIKSLKFSFKKLLHYISGKF